MTHWQTPFLSHLRQTGNVAASARVAGIVSQTAYNARKNDADFAAAWEVATDDHIDVLEQEATRRAMGYETPVIHKGEMTPVFERDEDGQLVMVESVVSVTDKKTGETRDTVVQQPKQAVDEHGKPKWLTVTAYSDTLLLAKLKAYRKRYATDRTELTGADGGAVSVDDSARSARIAQLMNIAKRRAEE